MKYLNNILSVILAFPYVAFGPSYWLHYIPMPPMEGMPGQYAAVLHDSGYMGLIKVFEIVFGLMIMFNFKRPLALILMAPITLNILFFELFFAHMPGIGLILTVLNGILIYRYRANYRGIMAPNTSGAAA
jgi:putative oxidoreductase